MDKFDLNTGFDPKPISNDAALLTPNSLQGKNPPAANNMSNREKAIAGLNKLVVSSNIPDENYYQKPFAFDAGIDGHNFERYYSHPKFKDLGFSPFRDNETRYNNNSSLWDDTQRAIPQFGKMVALSVSDIYGNWGDFLSGAPSTDSSEEMRKAMAIGSSSRDTFGAKALNFGVNFAYTAGIAGSIIAEEFALAGLEAYTVGGATPLVAAKTAANALRLKNAFKRLGDIYDVTKDLTKAKTAWDMSKGVGAFSRAVLPFQSTADLFRKTGRAAQDWDKLSDYAKAYKSFGAFYRDLREINLVTSESKLEGGGVQVRTAQELLGAFREREGRDPNEAEYTQIYNEARKAGFTASYANMAGIYASNKVVLNRLLKGIPGIAAAEHRAAKNLTSTIIKNEGWRVKGIDPFSKVANNYKRFYNKEWLKQTVKGSPQAGLRFLTANFMEGTQELYQEAVAEGVTKYYVDKYTQPTQAHRALMKHAIEHGLKSQMSGQGLEVFLSGFLMAAPMQAAGAAMKWGYDYKKIYDLKKKEAAFTADPANQGKTNPYTEAIKREKEWDDQVLTALNDITKNSGEFFSAVERNVNSQKDLTELFEDATLNNDTKTAIETRDDALFEHITTLIDSGTVDLFKDQLKDLRQLSDEELAEAFNEHGQKADGKNVRERIDSSLKRIEEIESAYERSKNLINPYDFMENPLEYLGFKEATRLMIFNEFAFKRTGDRMLSVQQDLVRKLGLGKIQYIDIAPLFSKGSAMNTGAATPTTTMGMDYEISLLEEQIKVYKQGSPEQQRMAKQLEDKKGTLSSLNLAVQNFVQRLKLTNSPNLSKADTDAYTEDLAQAEELLRKAFGDHLKILSEQSGEPILDQNIDEAFDSYRDYWRLSHDKTYLANAINQLHNPEVFKENAGRITEALREADRIKAQKAKEIVREYRTKYAKNTFLNDLLEKYNVYVSFEEADAYTDNEKVPSVFYDANTGKEVSPYTDPDKYNKITELIDEYDQIHFDITGRRLFKPNRQDTGVRVAGTIKDTDRVAGQLVGQFDPEDKRTYEEIASQFGFDKKEQSSQVNAGTVLKAIIDSKFSSTTQKELARKLMTLVDPTTLITFRKNLYVHSAYTPASGILVDARYSSSDYQNIVGIPMEYSILNAIGQKVVADALSTDEAFSNRIEELMELAKNGIPEKERPYFAYALNNKLNFAMEVLNNRDFQEVLNTIEYSGELTKQTAEAKTLWGTFLETLKDLLDTLLNITDPKLLNEAMNVITNKLSTSSIPPTQEKAPEGPAPKPTETIDYTDPVLINKLRAKYESVLAKAAPGEQVGSFDSWMRTNSEALEIARTHSIKKKVGAEGGSQNMTRDAIVRKLTSIGKTIQELNDMSDTEIADLLNRFDQLSAAYTPNLNDQDWGEVDVAMKQAFDKVAAADVKLNKEENVYEQTVLVGGQSIRNTFERVSHVVKKKSQNKPDEVSTQRGNIIDKLFKDFFKGNLQNIDDFEAAYKEIQKENPLVTFDSKALREVFDTARTAQNKLKEAGLKVIPDFPILFGKLGNIATAGEMDIIAYNKQGQVFIIDIKTALNTNRRFAYEVNTEFKTILGDKYFEFITALKNSNGMLLKAIETFSEKEADLGILLANKILDITDRYSAEKALTAQGKDIKIYLGYQEDDLRQQLAYKELLRQTTGLQATALSILPITVTNSPTNRSVVTSAKLIPDKQLQPDGTLQPKPKAPLLLTIDNSKTIYDLNIEGIEPLVNNYPENPLAKKAPQQTTDVITDDVYNDFVDNNNVPEEILNSIADKVIKRESLSQRETAIFNGKTGEINEIIKQKAAPAEKADVEVISENYTPELLRANPNKLFLFGDNNQRTGKGGQAIIRDEPNAAGISTKLLPKNTPEAFMSDNQLADNKAVIDSDIKKAKDRATKEGKTIVLPKGGFGTGLAALATKAPQTFAYLNQRLQEEFGFNNTTGELAALEGKQNNYKGVPIVEKSITASTGEPGGAQYNRTENIIYVNKPVLQSKFETKAWTTPRTQKDGSVVEAYPEDMFKTYEEWEAFVIEHEYQHSQLSRTEFDKSVSGTTTTADYENEINKRALESLGMKIPEVKPETKKGKEKDPKAKEKAAVKRKLADLRASINKIETKDDMSKFRLLLTTAQELGILDEIKDKQGVTPEVFKALMDQKLRQIENQITIAQLTSTEGPVTFTFLNKKGEKRTGIVVGIVDGSKLEIKDITDEIETSPSDWSFAGSGKSIILSEKDVNKQVLAITEQPDLPKPDRGTKEKSNAGEEVSGNDLEARKEKMKEIDIDDPNAAKDAADDLFTCDTDTPS